MSGNAILMLSYLSTPEAAGTEIIRRVEAGKKLSDDKVKAIIRKVNGAGRLPLSSGGRA
jgi:hypothetical protein